MAKVFPFRGTLYNNARGKIPHLNRLFTPPYDVIGSAEQNAFYEQHAFNYIRLILGQEFPQDNEYNNRYVRAAAFLDGWLRHKIMLQDDKPAFYAYEQRFSAGGRKLVRFGFIGLCRLEDFGQGKVYPHEETYPRAKLDRLLLMRATSANLEAVFALYNDEKNKVARTFKPFLKRKPLFEVTDKDKVVHRLWRIDRKSVLAKVMKEMKDKAIFIADGHHRYEAAIRYRNEQKVKNTKFSEDESYNHIMMYFTALEDKGLIVLPIHRAIHNPAYFDAEKFLFDLANFFTVIPYKAGKKTAAKVLKKLTRDIVKTGRDQHAFGLYLGQGRFYLLALKDESVIEEMVEEEKPKAWKKLDVTILHNVIFDRLLGIADQTADKITYTKNETEAVALVDNKGYQLAFLLNPTKLEEITAIASKLEKMPHKSTYFYPKLLSGLVLNKFVHGDKIKG